MQRRLRSECDLLRDLAILIPAHRPEPVLLELVSGLMAAGFSTIVVVEDGVSCAAKCLMQELRQAGTHVLEHAVNLGKGRALKSGFDYLLSHHANLSAVITVDADGQHTLPDVLRVATAFVAQNEEERKPVFGVRLFRGPLPLRSRVGNRLTRHVFTFVTGIPLLDTQTGLRCLPIALLAELVLLQGERYEYEMTMLLWLCQTGRRPLEVSINTLYFNDNRSSHFHPLWDSLRIYRVLGAALGQAARESRKSRYG